MTSLSVGNYEVQNFFVGIAPESLSHQLQKCIRKIPNNPFINQESFTHWISCSLCNPTFHWRIQKLPPLIAVPKQTNPAITFTYHWLKISFSSGFTTKILHASKVCPLHALCRPQFSLELITLNVFVEKHELWLSLCRSRWLFGLRRLSQALDCWDRGFESRWGHGCLSLVFVVRCIGSRLCDELKSRA
jgi:hypothetical protein